MVKLINSATFRSGEIHAVRREGWPCNIPDTMHSVHSQSLYFPLGGSPTCISFLAAASIKVALARSIFIASNAPSLGATGTPQFMFT